MSTFSVGSITSTSGGKQRGESFTANIAGPGGSGSPGTANPVYIQAATVGYANSNTATRTATAYIYDYLPTVADLNSGTNKLAISTGTLDGSLFGTGTYTRTFSFPAVSIDPTKIYYFLFPSDQNVRWDNTEPYSGGVSYSTTLGAEQANLAFLISLSTS